MTILTKLFLAICLLVALAAGSIWIIGGKSAKHSTEITINAHRADVFDWLVESEKIREWAPEITEVASIESKDQEESQRIVKEEEAEITYTDKVLRFDHGAMVSVRSTGRGIVQTQVFQLEGNSLGGTDLQFRITRKPSGLGRFLVPFRDDEVEKDMKRQMRKLKKLIETEERSMVVRDDSEQPMGFTSETSSPEVEVEVNSADKAGAADKAGVADKGAAGKVVEGVSGPTDLDREANRKRNFISLFGTG